MELRLSLGDRPSKKFDGVTATARQMFTKSTAAAGATSPSAAGACSLGFCMALTTKNGTNHQYEEKLANDGTNEDEDYKTVEDQEILKGNRRIKAVIDGSSDGGSSGNDPAGRELDVNSILVPPEEATSSLQLDFGSYSRTGKVIGNTDFELRDDTVEIERASSRASDEDENGVYRKKLRLSKQQSAYLEESFKDHSTLNPKQKLELAKKLNLSPRQVEVWFQNRRARSKLKQTEVDCEYLKKCCETLTEENRRLHKELQELRALKTTSNPFSVQLPATTLTMCPACVRVAATTFSTTTSAFPSAPPPPPTPNTKLRKSMSTTPCTSFPQTSKGTSLYPFLYAPPSHNSHH